MSAEKPERNNQIVYFFYITQKPNQLSAITFDFSLQRKISPVDIILILMRMIIT